MGYAIGARHIWYRCHFMCFTHRNNNVIRHRMLHFLFILGFMPFEADSIKMKMVKYEVVAGEKESKREKEKEKARERERKRILCAKFMIHTGAQWKRAYYVRESVKKMVAKPRCKWNGMKTHKDQCYYFSRWVGDIINRWRWCASSSNPSHCNR